MSLPRMVTASEIIDAIDRGWFPAWFSTSDENDDGADDTFNIDLCANTRLQDRKIIFLKCTDYTPDFIKLVSEKMIELWTQAALDCALLYCEL